MSDKSQGNHSESVSGAAVVGVLLVFLIVVVVGLLIFIPRYRVYSSEMTGRAELKRAEFNRKIAIYEAEAKKEAAELLAEAEIARARGVAEANVIIGVSLKENEAYLRWLWISSINETKNSIIYVPTEAGLPILEAGQRPASKE